MSLIPLRLVAGALLVSGLSACATTAPAGSGASGGTWVTRPRNGDVRVVGGTARTVRDEDLRASRANRTRSARPADATPVPVRTTVARVDGDARDAAARVAADLAAITMPVEGFSRDRLRDSFGADRDGGARRHNAIDLGAPTGTPVLAAAPGTVRKLHTSAKGGITVYVLGRDGRTVFYYAHLSRYAPGLREGQRVEAGDRLGDVGATGNAQGAHLHFAIWRATSPDAFWSGTPLNPYPYLRGTVPVAPVHLAEAPDVPVRRIDPDGPSGPAVDPGSLEAAPAARRTVEPAPRPTSAPRRGRW